MSAESVDNSLCDLCWPIAQLDTALHTLARHCGLCPDAPSCSAITQGVENIDTRLQLGAEALDLQIEKVGCSYGELEQMLARAAPAMIQLRFGERVYFIVLCGGNRRRLHLLTPTLKVQKVCPRRVVIQLTRVQAAPQRQRINHLLDSAGIGGRRRSRAAGALLRESLAGLHLEQCWMLRQPAHRPFWQQLRQCGQDRRFFAMLVFHALQMVLFLASWWVIGRALLGGYIDTGWLVAWVLLLVSQIPLSLLTAQLQGLVSVKTGALLKQRLLASALRIETGRVRHMGSGQVLGRVYDAESLEASALQGGFSLLLGLVEFAMACIVLALGAGGPLHLLVLLPFLLVALLLGRALYQRRCRWTARRLAMTHRLIEKMLGHRTRLAQQRPADWHRGEDRELSDYLQSSAEMDGTMVHLAALLPRIWLLLGVVGLVPVFISSNPDSAQLAVALGGVLLGYRAVLKCLHGFTGALSALVAWENVRELFALEAPLKRTSPGAEHVAAISTACAAATQPLCYLRDLNFSYPKKEKPVLTECSLVIYPGDRLLLQGASGSGKSTLANVITGLQKPDEGLLLLNGYDGASLVPGQWQRLVASAPQFHENHVLGDSFLFNLLMGDEWPPRQQSLRKAYAICDELGLTPLLQKMPAGMLQTVGEMGWRLSHGEMSRLFIARTLLQNAEMVVLDESFAALDPENLRRAMACVQKYATTLIVIAHP
ncbi:ABC transporter ATP-binding protein [Microbulbifer sp. 2205BS26-8]|uniref:ATP-binding cassette domain-containing protein n=1 Tax=Microbulbifer sp. 2205BS26-8 TaxID=3064386 RepID=UPI00273D2F86|nr:ABC transporter ATP-binding protein [Microbulbifer sp. 2205BS26-8]MDP5208611.1 ABC transporter ATP-binding protein [Microbulbifer sp. 2205BS26-8]